MKILILHNFYKQPGGEDVVVRHEKKLLEKNGHDVKLFTLSNSSIVDFSDKVKTAWNVTYSRSSFKTVMKELREFEPNIVHVHNFFPLFSPAIYDACRQAQVPVVQTLHNYRLVCANAQFLRDGKICEKCLDGNPYHSVLYRCYRNSLAGSIAVSQMIEQHKRSGTWQNKVDQFIILTEFAKKKFVQAELPAPLMSVKPNFTSDPGEPPRVDDRKPLAIFVGRLSEEKGILELLEAWKDIDFDLEIIGGGPLEEEVKERSKGRIKFLGSLESSVVQEKMREARFLVFPSKWFEGFPMVLVEALANGLPCIVPNLGGLHEIVEDEKSGLRFDWKEVNSLRLAIRKMIDSDDWKALARGAREKYLGFYTESRNYQELINIYQIAVKELKSRGKVSVINTLPRDLKDVSAVFFEPWSLGDAVIAAGVAKEMGKDAVVACHPRWHDILREEIGDKNLSFLGVDLPYTTRSRNSPWAFNHLEEAILPEPIHYLNVENVYSIRGDIRDFVVARRLFPLAKMHMNGWIAFIGRKNKFVDFPYQAGLLPIRNRYKAWAEIVGISFERVIYHYEKKRSLSPHSGILTLHIGAQWRSKQFPYVAELKRIAEKKGLKVQIIAGPGDNLPKGVSEPEVKRLINHELISAFKKSEYVVTNDSGPMHVAALCGCRTFVVARTSNLEEWVPPGTTTIESKFIPKGYRPDPRYMSDLTLEGWPDEFEVLQRVIGDRK